MVSEVEEFYSNDIVYRFDKHKRMSLGVVVDSYEASTEPDDSDDALRKGEQLGAFAFVVCFILNRVIAD